MGRKNKKKRKGLKAKVVIEGKGESVSYYYGKNNSDWYSGAYASYGPSKAKKVFEYKELEVWAGPWHARKDVDFDLYINLTGDEPKPMVQVSGLDLPVTIKTPRGVSIDWPDMGTPSGLHKKFWQALAEALAKEKGILYIGCTAGKGRTGAVLAILAGLWGLSQTPITFVRQVYNSEAVETSEQVTYVGAITGFKEEVQGSATRVVYSFPESASKKDAGVGTTSLGVTSSTGKVTTYYGYSLADSVNHILQHHLPKSLAHLKEAFPGIYEGELDDVNRVWYMGLVGGLLISKLDDGHDSWRVDFYVKDVEGWATSQLLSENIMVKRFFRQEEALVKLLEYIGIDPRDWEANSYRVDQVEIDAVGRYVHIPTKAILTLQEAADIITMGDTRGGQDKGQ